MPPQVQLSAFDGGPTTPGAQAGRLGKPPEDDELEELVAPNWMYEFEVNKVTGIDKLRSRIRDAEYSLDRVEEWSYILGDHLTYGNKKLDSAIAIFNMGTGHDCINKDTERCQVDGDECYAVRSEQNFPNTTDARRRELIIWDHLDAGTFAKAFREHVERKRNEVTTLRLNESGDFRSRHDILKADEIARRLSDLVDTYTYSASSWLPFHERNHFTLNASNGDIPSAERRFIVVDEVSEIPDGGLRCPHDQSDAEIKCGECRLCIDTDAPTVYVKKFN